MFLIINNAEPGITEFVRPLEKIVASSGNSFKTIEYEDTLKADLSKYLGFILSGSPRGDDIADHHQQFFRWIKDMEQPGATHLPVFGMCAGHHIVGLLYGAQLIRMKEKEVGDFLVEIDHPDPIFQGIEKSFQVRQNHHDSITLPPGFILLAHSAACKNAAMRHPRLPIYTTQFHPEILNPQLILNFIQLTKNKRIKETSS